MSARDLEVLAEGFVFLEGPRWHGERLWFSDMWGYSVHAMTASGVCETIATVPNRPSGLNFLPDGRLVVVSMADRKLLEVNAQGESRVYADLGRWSPRISTIRWSTPPATSTSVISATT